MVTLEDVKKLCDAQINMQLEVMKKMDELSLEDRMRFKEWANNHPLTDKVHELVKKQKEKDRRDVLQLYEKEMNRLDSETKKVIEEAREIDPDRAKLADETLEAMKTVFSKFINVERERVGK